MPPQVPWRCATIASWRGPVPDMRHKPAHATPVTAKCPGAGNGGGQVGACANNRTGMCGDHLLVETLRGWLLSIPASEHEGPP